MNIQEMGMAYNLYSWSAQKKINPITIVKAEGIYFWDETGKKYYDMSSQLVNLNLGHGNKKIIQAIKDQADKMAYLSPAYSIDVRSEAARRLVEIAGPEFRKVFFTNAGAEANENAIKMAKAVTGKWKVFSMYRSYHGATFGASSLTGESRRFIAEPGIPGFVHFDGPYPYRAPNQIKFKSEEDVTDYYLESLKTKLQYEGTHQIAAIFLETVVGSNGILIPPKGYLEGVRALCDKYNIMMVCDEVMAGFGRTGKWFAFQHWNGVPDMITFAKGATCGYFPLGGVIVNQRIAEYFDDNKMFCGLTYSAHPIGCAATVATLDAYVEDKVFDNVVKVGKVLGELLEDLKRKHESIGDVRYIGLFSIIELVKNKSTREPIVPLGEDPNGIMPKIIGMLKAEGFSTYSIENMIHISPPLIITEEQLNEAMEIVDRVFYSIDNMIQ